MPAGPCRCARPETNNLPYSAQTLDYMAGVLNTGNET
jgi:hypothetical protein